jgi:DNA-binding MarR family transcriptional regulator
VATTIARKPAEAVWKLLRDEAFASLRDDFSARASQCNLTLSQAKLVRELVQPQSQRELARRLHYDPSNITALADSLETRGLIKRQPGATDRRFRLLALTPLGERLRSSLEELLAQPPLFLNRLTSSEQKQLLDLLAKVFDRPSASQPISAPR